MLKLKDSKILITGGAGFIGGHIATRCADDNDVIIYDNFTTGKQENLAHLENKPNVKILKVDVRDFSTVYKNMAGVDYVFHLAAITSVPQSIEEPQETNEHNITGTLNILQAAHLHKVKKVIFSTSAAVYGDEPTLPKLETFSTMPKSPYAVSKITGEQYCQVFYEQYKLPTVALRYFNVFGPRQDPSAAYAAVVPKFIERVTNNKLPIIYGSGEQTRDLIYVDDVVDANIKAALSNKANGEIINIACGKPTSVKSLAKMIIELSGNKLEPKCKPARPGDIKHSYADISKARSILDWAPKVVLYTGLKNTYDHLQEVNSKKLEAEQITKPAIEISS